mgnify:CR=1 FL=1
MDKGIEPLIAGTIWITEAKTMSTILIKVKFYGNTAILLSDIDLVAQVGGNLVTNPFMVTEVYVLENNAWKMAQLTFSHLSRPVKLKQ